MIVVLAGRRPGSAANQPLAAVATALSWRGEIAREQYDQMLAGIAG